MDSQVKQIDLEVKQTDLEIKQINEESKQLGEILDEQVIGDFPLIYNHQRYHHHSDILSEIILKNNICYVPLHDHNELLNAIRYYKDFAIRILFEISNNYKMLQKLTSTMEEFPKFYYNIINSIKQDSPIETYRKHKYDIVDNIMRLDQFKEVLEIIQKAHAYLIIGLNMKNVPQSSFKITSIIIHYENDKFIIIDPRIQQAGIINLESIIKYVFRTGNKVPLAFEVGQELNEYLELYIPITGDHEDLMINEIGLETIEQLTKKMLPSQIKEMKNDDLMNLCLESDLFTNKTFIGKRLEFQLKNAALRNKILICTQKKYVKKEDLTLEIINCSSDATVLRYCRDLAIVDEHFLREKIINLILDLQKCATESKIDA